MRGITPTGTRFSEAPGTLDATVNWSFKAGLLGLPIRSTPAIGSDGSIYFGAREPKVYALDADGNVRWTRQTLGFVDSSPALSPAGVVYVGSDDFRLYALDAKTGTKLWDLLTLGPVRSSPVLANDGTIFFGSGDHKLYAVTPAGAVRWSYFSILAAVDSSPALSPDQSTVYFASGFDVLALRTSDGSLRWRYHTGGLVESSPVVGAGLVYIGSDDDRLYALDANTGAVRFQVNLGGDVNAAPATDGHFVYVGSDANKVTALAAMTGNLLWTVTLTKPVRTSPVLSSDGVVYVGCDDHFLHALDAVTGTEYFKVDAGNIVRSSPALGRFGTLYFGSDDGRLRSVGEATPRGGFVDEQGRPVGQCRNNVRTAGTTSHLCLSSRAANVASVSFFVDGKATPSSGDCVDVPVSGNVEVRAFEFDATGAEVASPYVFLTSAAKHCPVYDRVVVGTAGDDVLYGTASDEYISGGPGNDYIAPYRGGAHTLVGGDGQDVFDVTRLTDSPVTDLSNLTISKDPGDVIRGTVTQAQFLSRGPHVTTSSSGVAQLSAATPLLFAPESVPPSDYEQVTPFETTLGMDEFEGFLVGMHSEGIVARPDGGYVTASRGAGNLPSVLPKRPETLPYASAAFEVWDANGHLVRRTRLSRPQHFVTAISRRSTASGSFAGYWAVGYVPQVTGLDGYPAPNSCKSVACKTGVGFVLFLGPDADPRGLFYIDGSFGDDQNQLTQNNPGVTQLYAVTADDGSAATLIAGTVRTTGKYQDSAGNWQTQSTPADFAFAAKVGEGGAFWARGFRDVRPGFSASAQRLDGVSFDPPVPLLSHRDRLNAVFAGEADGRSLFLKLDATTGLLKKAAIYSDGGEERALGLDVWQVRGDGDCTYYPWGTLPPCNYGFVIGGESSILPHGDPAQRFGAMVSRLDANGNPVWPAAPREDNASVNSTSRIIASYAKARANAVATRMVNGSTDSFVLGGVVKQPWSDALRTPGFTPEENPPVANFTLFGDHGLYAQVDLNGNLTRAFTQGHPAGTPHNYDTRILDITQALGDGTVAAGASTACWNEPGHGITDPSCVAILGKLTMASETTAVFKVDDFLTPIECGPGVCQTNQGIDPRTGKQCDCDVCAQLDCDDKNPCTTDTCDNAVGCKHTACAGTDACHPSFCKAGVGCVPQDLDCDDHNDCTDDSCDTAAGGCVHPNNTAPCDDGDACTVGDQCSGGTCVAGAGADCNDGNPCTDDGCGAQGCTNTPNTAGCDDHDACTQNDRCQAGSCRPGTATNCDDSNDCTDDSCNSSTGCTHSNNTASCNDGNACTSGDQCGGGSCKGTPSCDDGKPCTADGCGTTCEHSPIADNTPCDTGKVCRGGECVVHDPGPSFATTVSSVLGTNCGPCHKENSSGTCATGVCFASNYAVATSKTSSCGAGIDRPTCIERRAGNDMPPSCPNRPSPCISTQVTDTIRAWVDGDRLP